MLASSRNSGFPPGQSVDIRVVGLFNRFIRRIALTKQNFTLKYDTNIPRQVVSIPLGR